MRIRSVIFLLIEYNSHFDVCFGNFITVLLGHPLLAQTFSTKRSINGCVYHLSQVRKCTFQYPLSKRVCKRLPKRVCRIVAFYHRTLSRALSLRSCIAQFDPWSRDHVGRAPLRRSVGDINAFQNDFACIISIRVSDRTYFGVSERRF